MILWAKACIWYVTVWFTVWSDLNCWHTETIGTTPLVTLVQYLHVNCKKFLMAIFIPRKTITSTISRTWANAIFSELEQLCHGYYALNYYLAKASYQLPVAFHIRFLYVWSVKCILRQRSIANYVHLHKW